ncbi:uncharacterized protein LOC116174540 [Photinus pyralis]|uniref:uncharacterized protein LOC116174540 n=1 Tax=Photinus pyralis TaxID=7054 RepID=UPI00126773A5|nr:uncharacterized protein LOC116174540 [Photinus pyralis]
MENITLFHQESNTEYQICCTIDEARKAATDITFATEMLNKLIEQKECKENDHPNVENPTEVVEDDSEPVYRWSSSAVTLLLRTYEKVCKTSSMMANIRKRSVGS